ncbi:transpeptidase [Corynebacterium sp. 13CS0277]|uniref:L,D-transpeptidase n=1 Tax=Corynebacterium sp. 13CS0277 TaxID=2071994 RepID=UPI000D046FA1|nr:transpeptidase [Corynebacterium sp. 13CS0277]
MLRGVAVVAAAALAATLTACTIDKGESETVEAAAQTSAMPMPPVASVADGATEVNPDTPVTVKAVDGTLTEVQMVNETGKVIEASIKDGGKTWSTDEVLGYNRTYTITATASNGQTLTTTFQTIAPTALAEAYLSPIPDSTVGIGQVIAITFNTAIPDREAAQKAITIETTPHVDGAFYWLNDRVLRWRPKDFWTPGTEVSVDVKLHGVKLGDGVWGDEDNATNFTIGDAIIAYADDNTKTMTITKDGEEIISMPISMGRDKYATPNGTYVLGDRSQQMVMDSSTYGLSTSSPDGYRTTVNYATQMSWSGIYVHSAPWSVWAQGSQNTSHGCLNVSPANAEWFFNNTKRGDVVIVKNTIGGTLNGYDGLGDWNIPWETWSAGNAQREDQ